MNITENRLTRYNHEHHIAVRIVVHEAYTVARLLAMAVEKKKSPRFPVNNELSWQKGDIVYHNEKAYVGNK